MQAFLEILALFILFLLFRQSVVLAFPVKKLGMELSADSKRALNLYRRRYIVLFWLFGIALSAAFLGLFYSLFEYLHTSDEYEQVLLVSSSSIFLPSVILGLLFATFLARATNEKMQSDGLSFFFEGYQDEEEGFARNKLQAFHIIIGLALSMIILVFQFNTYLKFNDSTLFYKERMMEEKQFSRDSIRSISKDEHGNYQILIADKDTISTQKFGGDIDSFISALSK